MKITTFLFSLALILQTGFTHGQVTGNKKFDDYYQRKNLEPVADQTTKNVFYFTGTFPFSVTRIEAADDWGLRPSLSIGNGGLFIFGKSTFNGNNARIITPVFAFGIAADVGVKQVDDKMKTTFNGNFIIGFHRVNLMLGYDFLNNTNYIGLGLRVDLIALSPNSIYIFSEKDAKKLRK